MFTGIILLVIALAFLVMGILKTVNAANNVHHINEVMFDESNNQTDRIAYLDTYGYFSFAMEGDDLVYYYAYDDDFYYIISVPEKDYDYFAEKFEKEEYVRLYGYTARMSDNIKNLAVEVFNEEMDDGIITMQEFDDVFGTLMLEVIRDEKVFSISSFFHLAGVHMFVSGLFLIFGLILFITEYKNHSRWNEVLNDVTLKEELDSDDTVTIEKAGILLTPHLLVSVKGRVKTIPYEEIAWLYVTNHRTNFIPDYDYLNIHTVNDRHITCGNSSVVGKKNREMTENIHKQIIFHVVERNPEVLLGYSSENLTAYNAKMKYNKEC